MNSTAPLARITCADESQFTVYAAMKGHLMEVNEHLVDKPTLLAEKVWFYELPDKLYSVR